MISLIPLLNNQLTRLSIKLVVLILTVFDLEVSMWLAIFSDVGVSLLAILNSLRVMNIYKKEKEQINKRDEDYED
jgi:cation transport ATPase